LLYAVFTCPPLIPPPIHTLAASFCCAVNPSL
jgi:hypothetical protein